MAHVVLYDLLFLRLKPADRGRIDGIPETINLKAAAGMTDEETSAELLLSLAGKHTIVFEHDMTFVRQISKGRKVTVLHQGSVLCEGAVDRHASPFSV